MPLSMHSRHPGLLVFFGTLFFLLCDFIIFRSGLYNHIIGTNSPFGLVAHMADLEQHRKPSGKKEVLMMGNSKSGWAFSMKQYDQFFRDSPIEILQGSIDNTELKVWYYMLKFMDPKHNKYAGIIIPLSRYKIDSSTPDLENDYTNGQMDALILPTVDWPEFLSTYSKIDEWKKILILGLFASHNFALDLQDLLLNPIKRWQDIGELNDSGSLWARSYDWGGEPETIEALKIDNKGNKIVNYPPHFLSWMRREADEEFVQQTPLLVHQYTYMNFAYVTRWLNKIIDLYKNSPTKLIIFQLPRVSIDLPSHQLLPAPPDIRDFCPHPYNLYWLDEGEFDFLSEPRYFHDLKHVNRQARHLFTYRLGESVQQIIGGNR